MDEDDDRRDLEGPTTREQVEAAIARGDTAELEKLFSELDGKGSTAERLRERIRDALGYDPSSRPSP